MTARRKTRTLWIMPRRYAAWAPLPLRILLGIGFMVHGYDKLFVNHVSTAEFFGNLGIPLPELMAWAVGVVEFFGGLMLIIGALTTIVAALCAIDMIVAILLVHLPNGFSGPGGYELTLIYLAGFLSLIISGAGPLSVDRRLENRTVERQVV